MKERALRRVETASVGSNVESDNAEPRLFSPPIVKAIASIDALIESAAERGAEKALERATALQSPVVTLLDREALARRLSISVPTLDKLRREERFPCIWITDECPRFEVEPVVAWLRARGAK